VAVNPKLMRQELDAEVLGFCGVAGRWFGGTDLASVPRGKAVRSSGK